MDESSDDLFYDSPRLWWVLHYFWLLQCLPSHFEILWNGMDITFLDMLEEHRYTHYYHPIIVVTTLMTLQSAPWQITTRRTFKMVKMYWISVPVGSVITLKTGKVSCDLKVKTVVIRSRTSWSLLTRNHLHVFICSHQLVIFSWYVNYTAFIH